MAITSDDAQVILNMQKRVDRLMKAVQIEVKDSGLRFELVSRLVAVRELLDVN